jgi:hypothetical protein
MSGEKSCSCDHQITIPAHCLPIDNDNALLS